MQAGLQLRPTVIFEICVSDRRARYTRTQTYSAATFEWPLPTRRNYAGSISEVIKTAKVMMNCSFSFHPQNCVQTTAGELAAATTSG